MNEMSGDIKEVENNEEYKLIEIEACNVQIKYTYHSNYK